jgi:molecular chaperone DnaJ
MAFEFYTLLWISQGASQDEIKKAYRKKAMELHPDRHQGDKAKEAEFKKVNEAYATLWDTQKRSLYDRSGGNSNTSMGGGGFDMNFDVNDIFESFFWGWFWGSSRGRRRNIGGDLEIEIPLSFEEAYTWVTRTCKIKKHVRCPDCQGSGGQNPAACWECRGHGRVKRRSQTIFGYVEQLVSCDECGWNGQKFTSPCKTCHQEGYVENKQELPITVPAGIDSGMTLKVNWEGHWGADGSGDLYITFTVPHTFEGFSRNEHTLNYTLSLDPVDLILGKKIELQLPMVGKKSITLSAGTQIGETIQFRWEGFKKIQANGRGDFLIQIACHIPQKLSAQQLELYEALRNMQDEKSGKKKGGFFHL